MLSKLESFQNVLFKDNKKSAKNKYVFLLR